MDHCPNGPSAVHTGYCQLYKPEWGTFLRISETQVMWMLPSAQRIRSPVRCKRTMLRYVLPCVRPYSAEPVLAALVENTRDYTRFVSWWAMIWAVADIWGVSWYIYSMVNIDKRWLHYEQGMFWCSHPLCILMMTPWHSWPVQQVNRRTTYHGKAWAIKGQKATHGVFFCWGKWWVVLLIVNFFHYQCLLTPIFG
jgi:hypothetical protein